MFWGYALPPHLAPQGESPAAEEPAGTGVGPGRDAPVRLQHGRAAQAPGGQPTGTVSVHRSWRCLPGFQGGCGVQMYLCRLGAFCQGGDEV